MPDNSRAPQSYARGELVIVVDVADLKRAADFWTQALGFVQEGDASARYLSLLPADGNGIEVLLQKVDDEKHGKNRLHLDLRTHDLDAEVDRVRGLGASVVTEEPIVESGWTWHVLADPDGNEFCVLQSPSRRA
jgi:predicted enzyme related to lactoylglutathione lyase